MAGQSAPISHSQRLSAGQSAPISLSSPVEVCDKLGIEPPVSDDLILTMATIFTTQELRNIVLLHGGETMQRAMTKHKSLLDHMRTPKALKDAEANTPLRRIRSGRDGNVNVRPSYSSGSQTARGDQ